MAAHIAERRDFNENDHLLQQILIDEAAIPKSLGIQNLVVNSVLKLKCFVFVLFLIALGFTATVIEYVKVHESVSSDQGVVFGANYWICWVIKCAYPLAAIAAIVYLRRVVLIPGKIAEAYVNQPGRPGRRRIFLNVQGYITTPRNVGSYPSILFIVTFVIFAVFKCISGGIEIICGMISSVEPDKKASIIFEVFRQILLMVFAVMQAEFFFVHYRRTIQWKLSGTWLCGCHILAANIAAWFANVGFELREIGNSNSYHPASNRSHESYCSGSSTEAISRMLYPFVVEYHVMSALMAYTLVSNAGRIGAFLQSHLSQQFRNESQENIESLLRSELHPDVVHSSLEFAMLRRHSRSFALGLGLILISLIVSIFVAVKSPEDPIIRCLFYCTLILLYFCGIISIVLLLRSLSKTSEHQLSSAHLTDRLLLWLGASAIAVNDLYTFWIAWTKLGGTDEDRLKTANHFLLSISCALNICQSLMQVFALESALIRKFPSRHPSELRSNGGSSGRALLNLLILLNAAEWIINTICFSFFFPKEQIDDALVLSLVAMPLQVFFRFHSAVCIHDFKKHCESAPLGEASGSANNYGVASETDSLPPINFPDLAPVSIVDTIRFRRT